MEPLPPPRGEFPNESTSELAPAWHRCVAGWTTDSAETPGRVSRIDAATLGDRKMRGVHCTAVACVAFGAALGAVRLSAQESPDSARPPQLPPLERPAATWPDRAIATGGYEFSDLQSVSLALVGDDLVFQADFQRQLYDGMFTCVEVDYDCDGRRSDVEIATRASVGSRFRPTSFVPRAGEVPPIQLARASWLSAFAERGPTERTRQPGLVNQGSLLVPEVGGNSLRFVVPKRLASDRGVRGATTPPAIRVRAITTCGDHPLAFDYDAIEAGRDVRVDGTTGEWSGGPYLEDPGGELHVAVRHMDLRAVWCEHGPSTVFLRIDFDRPGFGRVAGDGDVAAFDVVWVELEPKGEAYMAPVLVALPATRPVGIVRGVRYAAGSGVVEVSIPRDPKQSAFHVAVWAEAVRVDPLDGDWLPLPRDGVR